MSGMSKLVRVKRKVKVLEVRKRRLKDDIALCSTERNQWRLPFIKAEYSALGFAINTIKEKYGIAE